MRRPGSIRVRTEKLADILIIALNRESSCTIVVCHTWLRMVQLVLTMAEPKVPSESREATISGDCLLEDLPFSLYLRNCSSELPALLASGNLVLESL